MPGLRAPAGVRPVVSDAEKVIHAKAQVLQAIQALRLEVDPSIANDIERRFHAFCESVSNVIDPLVFVGGGKMPIPWCKCGPEAQSPFVACQACFRPIEGPR